MGIRQALDAVRNLPEVVARGSAPPVGLASPLSPGGVDAGLESVVWADVTGIDRFHITRADAMQVPSVARARGLIVTTVASCDLKFRTDDDDDAEPPLWASRSDGPQSAYIRMLHTADDLLFYGWSAWAVDRDTRGNIIRAAHIRRDQWTVTDAGEVMVSDVLVDQSTVILFEGVHEGILVVGRDAIRHASALNTAAQTAAANPAAYLELHQTGGAPMDDEQIDRLIRRWSDARNGKHGGVAYTNATMEVKEHGTFSEHLLVDGRNAAAVDVARVMGVPSATIDATLQGSSMSYVNTAGRMAELVTFGVAPLMSAISARLGMDDVSPRGTAVDFDTAALMQSPVMRVAVPDDAAPAKVDTPPQTGTNPRRRPAASEAPAPGDGEAPA